MSVFCNHRRSTTTNHTSGQSERREERAEKDSLNIDEWVVADQWHRMVKQAMLGLKFVADHKEDHGFGARKSTIWKTNSLWIFFLIFMNTYPGRCGGWELILRSEMHSQLARQEHNNVFTFSKHKTAKNFGPLKKYVPNSVVKASRLYSELIIFAWLRSLHYITHECKEGGVFHFSQQSLRNFRGAWRVAKHLFSPRNFCERLCFC